MNPTHAVIKDALERKIRLLKHRPSIAQGTATSRTTLKEGMVCDVEEGRWQVRLDISPKSGGTGSAPDPGVFGRAALGSCMAMTYQRWAILLDIPVDAITVEVQADYDAQGQYDLAPVPISYTAVRVHVTIDSPASDDDLQYLLDFADAHCPYLDVFRRALPVERTVSLTTSTSI